MIDIMKIVQALEDSNILWKGVTKAIKIKKIIPMNMLSGTLLRNLLTGKGTVRAGEGIKKKL